MTFTYEECRVLQSQQGWALWKSLLRRCGKTQFSGKQLWRLCLPQEPDVGTARGASDLPPVLLSSNSSCICPSLQPWDPLAQIISMCL